MHRQKLIDQLSDYRLKFRDEANTVDVFVKFITENPRCFERDCWIGHITGSAWLVDGPGKRVLLTHHKKLDRWLQLGGHSDGDADTTNVALREAEEESGLDVLLGFSRGEQRIHTDIFDIDVHEIPA